MIADITAPAGSVSNAELATMGTKTYKGRTSAGTGAPEDVAVTTLKTDLGLTGTNSGDQTITLTGPVTGAGTGTFGTTIAANAIKTNQLAYALVAVTVSNGQATGASAAAAGLVGAAILAITPAGNQDQFVDNVEIAGDGAITVTLAAAATADNIFNVTVLKAI